MRKLLKPPQAWILLWALVCGCVLPGNAGDEPSASQEAQVSGVITDVNDARIVGATITFRGKQGGIQARSSYAGTYSVHLAPGTYTAEVEAPNFCSARRGAFTVQARSRVGLDFQLLAFVFINRVEIGPDLKPVPPPVIFPPESHSCSGGYEWEELQPVTDKDSPYHLLIMFGRRESDGDVTRYAGLVSSGRPMPVVVTYNLITIRANSVTYNTRTGALTAQGHLVLQDGSTAASGMTIEVVFKGGEPYVDLHPN